MNLSKIVSKYIEKKCRIKVGVCRWWGLWEIVKVFLFFEEVISNIKFEILRSSNRNMLFEDVEINIKN